MCKYTSLWGSRSAYVSVCRARSLLGRSNPGSCCSSVKNEQSKNVFRGYYRLTITLLQPKIDLKIWIIWITTMKRLLKSTCIGPTQLAKKWSTSCNLHWIALRYLEQRWWTVNEINWFWSSYSIQNITEYFWGCTYKHLQSGSRVSNWRNTKNLESKVVKDTRRCIFELLDSYLSHTNVSTTSVDVRIIGKKISNSNIGFWGNCGAGVTRLHNLNCGTILTNKTKTKYLRERRIFFEIRLRLKRIEEWLLRPGINCRKQGQWSLHSPLPIGILHKGYS